MMNQFSIIFTFFEFFFVVDYCVGLEPLNHSMAQLYCKDNGGLFKYTNVIQDGFVMQNLMNLDAYLLTEGETAWISGYVIYSSFLNWQGCYKENFGSLEHSSYPNQAGTITWCVERCKLKPVKVIFIGLCKDKCYCIEDMDVSTKVKIINDINCTHQEPYNIYFNSTYTDTCSTINVFKISENLPFDNKRQCIVAKNVLQTVSYETRSCYTDYDDVDGLICINGPIGQLKCDKYYDQTNEKLAFCLEYRETSWIGANERCNALSGKIIDVDLFAKINKRTNRLNDKYWMGHYRSFKVIDLVTETCLAVTKKGMKLVLDPDDCSEKKKYICNIPFEKTTTQTAQSTSNENINGNTIHIGEIAAIAVSLAALLVLVVIILVRKLKKRREHKRSQESISVNNDDRSATTPKSVVNNECSDTTLESCNDKIKPKKPIRQTLRKHNMSCSYENFMIKTEASPADTNYAAGNLNEDYDRLDLKVKSPDSHHDREMGENNVYDHTVTEESYDTFRSLKSVKYSDSVTYSTLQRRSKATGENDENLSDNTRVSVSRDEHDDNKGDTTCTYTIADESSNMSMQTPEDVQLLNESN